MVQSLAKQDKWTKKKKPPKKGGGIPEFNFLHCKGTDLKELSKNGGRRRIPEVEKRGTGLGPGHSSTKKTYRGTSLRKFGGGVQEKGGWKGVSSPWVGTPISKTIQKGKKRSTSGVSLKEPKV